jgi:hypothetical protein
MMRFRLERVHYMPKELESGVLYVAEEFGTAAHLCACGCGSKIRTPIGATEWEVEETAWGPSLRPSVGNWQKPCHSHYWIREGEVIWSERWSPEEIAAGRAQEEALRTAYYDALCERPRGLLRRVWDWVKQWFTR